jgi:hypothetical protein
LSQGKSEKYDYFLLLFWPLQKSRLFWGEIHIFWRFIGIFKGLLQFLQKESGNPRLFLGLADSKLFKGKLFPCSSMGWFDKSLFGNRVLPGIVRRPQGLLQVVEPSNASALKIGKPFLR